MNCPDGVISETRLGLAAALLFVALLLANSVYVIAWAISGIRKRRVVLSADGKHALHGRQAFVFAGVAVMVGTTFAALLVWIARCALRWLMRDPHS